MPRLPFAVLYGHPSELSRVPQGAFGGHGAWSKVGHSEAMGHNDLDAAAAAAARQRAARGAELEQHGGAVDEQPEEREAAQREDVDPSAQLACRDGQAGMHAGMRACGAGMHAGMRACGHAGM